MLRLSILLRQELPIPKTRKWSITPKTLQEVKSKSIYSADAIRPNPSYQPSFPVAHQGPYGSPMLIDPPPVLPSPRERLIQKEVFKETDPWNLKNLLTIKQLFDAGAHSGHASERRHPQMNKYIFGERYGMDYIDLDQTLPRFYTALAVAATVAFRNGSIIAVCDSDRHQAIINELTSTTDIMFMNSESVPLNRADLLKKWDDSYLTGEKMPDLFIFFGTMNQWGTEQHRFIDYANKMFSCSIGIIDTDSNPSGLTYRIPANDDSSKCMRIYCNAFQQAILNGYARRDEYERKYKLLDEAQLKAIRTELEEIDTLKGQSRLHTENRFEEKSSQKSTDSRRKKWNS